MNLIDDAIRRADELRDQRRFPQAAQAYRRAVELAPSRADLLVQLGNMLKDAGDPQGAIRAYEQALQRSPDEADTFLQLGRAHTLNGDRPAALAAFGRALQLAPPNLDVANELIRLGEGWQAGRSQDIGDRLMTSVLRLTDEMRRKLREIEEHLPLIASLVRLPPERHDDWRQTRQASLPPNPAPGFTVAAVIRGHAPLPDVLQVLASLQIQSHPHCLFAMPDLTGDGLDAYLRLANARPDRYLRTDNTSKDLTEILARMPVHHGVLLARTPLVLDRHLIAWAAATLSEGAAAVVPDEDVLHHDGAIARFEAPRLAANCDPEWLEQGFDPGSAIAARAAALRQALAELGDAPDPARLVLALMRHGPVQPLPEIFVSRPAGAPLAPAPALITLNRTRDASTFTVVIPTRDRTALLAACLDALERTAGNRERLRIVVVDNGSREADAIRFLAEGHASGRFITLSADEPFNWSRFNRLGAAARHSDHLLFLNNDVQMISECWDDVAADLLARAEVGVVGAKLLYPNGTIQHAGMYVKTPGRLEHAGRGEPADAPGPMGLYQRRHSVTSVTGAWLAMRRDVFDRLGGFDDEGLPLWFNDVDFCLKTHAAGLRVIYEPALTAWHHESLSTEDAFSHEVRQAHFDAAHALIRVRWGAVLKRDAWMRL